MTFADVDTFAMRLPGVTIATSWGHRTWMVGKRAFAWQLRHKIVRFEPELFPALWSRW